MLIKRYDDTEIKGLRAILDRLRDRLDSGIIVIGGAKDGKASLLVSVSKDLVDRYKAGELVSALAVMVGGKGGGRPDSAQGGGPNVGAIDDALAAAQEWISSQS